MNNNQNDMNNNGQNNNVNVIKELFHTKGITGLVGGNNRCYMNTAIQCLSNTVYLSYYFLTDSYVGNTDINKKETKLLFEWIKLLKAIWEENCTVEPISFTKSIYELSKKQDNIFHDFEQHDVGEFILYLIQNFHESLSQKQNSKIDRKRIEMRHTLSETEKMFLDSEVEWEKCFSSGFSIFVKLFYGQYISVVSTIDNNIMQKEMSFSYEPFSMLDLEIPTTPNTKDTIYDCLHMMAKDDFLTEENKWYSTKTNSYRDAKRNLLILLPPQILIIALKRFRNTGNKSNKFIDFPLNNLDISPYVINKTNSSCNYNLYAVANHVGKANYGHYYCYCKNINNNWYEYDDDKTNQIKSENVVTKNAYLLFYIRN